MLLQQSIEPLYTNVTLILLCIHRSINWEYLINIFIQYKGCSVEGGSTVLYI